MYVLLILRIRAPFDSFNAETIQSRNFSETKGKNAERPRRSTRKTGTLFSRVKRDSTGVEREKPRYVRRGKKKVQSKLRSRFSLKREGGSGTRHSVALVLLVFILGFVRLVRLVRFVRRRLRRRRRRRRRCRSAVSLVVV